MWPILESYQGMEIEIPPGKGNSQNIIQIDLYKVVPPPSFKLVYKPL